MNFPRTFKAAIVIPSPDRNSHQMQDRASLNVVLLGCLVICHLLSTEDEPGKKHHECSIPLTGRE
jgi:hypothetical protein